MASSLLDVVSSGPKTRKLFMLRFITSRRKLPSGRVFSAMDRPRLVDAATRIRGNRAGAALSSACRRWREDWRSCGECRWAPELLQFGNQFSVGIEQLFRLLGAHPALQNAKLLGILLHIGQRNLMGAPEAFQAMAFDFLRSASSLWASAARSSASAAGVWRKPCAEHRCCIA